MKSISLASTLLVTAVGIIPSSSAFSTRLSSPTTHVRHFSHRLHHHGHVGHEGGHLDRRSAVSIFTLLPFGLLASSDPARVNAESDKGKVVVFGGAGWVGAHVSADLQKRGYRAVSISRSAADVQAERAKSILGSSAPGVEYVSLDAGTASLEDLASVVKDSVAVISCLGVTPGSPNQKEGNSQPNVRIAKAAKSAGVPRLVYIGVASSLAKGPAKFLLGDYFQGKAEAENSVKQEFGEDSLIIKPAIIAGGTPGEIRPPGPPGVKPVDVEAVAKLAVSGALGNLKGTIDGNENIASLAN
ncbi:hypothetical protein ACHAWF_005048 [Thalassiosira exigua]